PLRGRLLRPEVVPLRALLLGPAGLEILADQLHVLGIDAVAVFAQGDLADLQERLGLLDPGLRLRVTDALRLQLVVEGGRIERADHVAGLDPGPFGEDGDDPRRTGFLHVRGAAARTAAATATATAAAAAATTTATTG